ncbi:hypothetical protein [Niveispirillum sp.]|uniref:hypothetical protein n=1 Tax=Niveispirillum sp. TaxID=1917217 RepID=UPI001B4A0A35|nr:hypothetical protein [Niveispirillum sp.]MBP7338534.1 hypothetical protein [Niveispirillum sp.]
MAVSSNELELIEGMLRIPEGADPFPSLRQRFAHLVWTRCDAADVLEEPFRSIGPFDLHLLDGSDHCLRLTPEPDKATGVLLARRGGVS